MSSEKGNKKGGDVPLLPSSAAVPNFDDMGVEDLRDNGKNLFNENQMLKMSMFTAIGHFEMGKGQMNEEIKQLTANATQNYLTVQRNTSLEESNLLLLKANELKDNEIVELKALVAELQEENVNLKSAVHKYEDIIQRHETRIELLESMANPITIREAMRILERCLCLEAAGSKNSFKKKFYNFDKIRLSGDLTTQSNLATVLTTRGLSLDHIDYLGYLKDCGDLKVHHEQPVLSPDEL